MRWYVVVFAFFIFNSSLSGQTVWPGDVNNNGVVNGADLLYWGIAFGSSGPSRSEVSTDWQAVPLLSFWTQTFPNGLNYAYTDCDGNGVVDEEDFDKAIDDNFGLTHGTPQPDGYANGQLGAAPRLRLQPDAEIVGFGATVNIGLSLDDSVMPVSDFYGLAFTLSYTTGILAGDDGPDFELAESSWIEADNSYVQDLFVDNNGQGQAQLAITRTNQQAIPINAGEIGRFSIVIEDIIVGRDIDTFHLIIDSILLINDKFGKIPVAPDTVTIIVSKDPKITATNENSLLQTLNIFPNPAQSELNIVSQIPIQELNLIDNLGRVLPLELEVLQKGTHRIPLPILASGVYWLSAKTPGGVISRKIIIISK
ncbi:MAG: T9SS type A sorting domain-containing protein [Saprospiraceae bacterium]|nr:T9SS type A sorting domain-containing protein [Saprospiraceae bacterium]